MADQPTTRDQLIERALAVTERHMGGYHATKERQRNAVRALADAGLLADPEQHADAVVRDRLRRARVEREQLGGARTERDLALWLHAESKHQHAELLAQRDGWWDHVGREQAKITAERDEAVALCASLQSALLSRLADLTEAAGKERSTEWLRTCATLPPEEWPPAPAYKGPMVPAAERDALQAKVEQLLPLIEEREEWRQAARADAAARDALQARIEAVSKTCDAADIAVKIGAAENPARWETAQAAITDVRAALQGAQPTEPETRCMNGPAKQHTLRMVEIIKALRAASAGGALPGELDDRASFAQLARAIVDHWPTGEADRG